jgi:hypothetical protein
VTHRHAVVAALAVVVTVEVVRARASEARLMGRLADLTYELGASCASRDDDIDEALALADAGELTTAMDALVFLLDPRHVVTGRR